MSKPAAKVVIGYDFAPGNGYCELIEGFIWDVSWMPDVDGIAE